jgi:hypothetical protein
MVPAACQDMPGNGPCGLLRVVALADGSCATRVVRPAARSYLYASRRSNPSPATRILVHLGRLGACSNLVPCSTWCVRMLTSPATRSLCVPNQQPAESQSARAARPPTSCLHWRADTAIAVPTGREAPPSLSPKSRGSSESPIRLPVANPSLHHRQPSRLKRTAGPARLGWSALEKRRWLR